MMNQKLRGKIIGMLYYNMLFLGWVVLNLRNTMKGIENALFMPVGQATRAITTISYSWTDLTLVISENGKYNDTVTVSNLVFVTVAVGLLYNIYCIIKLFRMKDSEALSENKTMFNDESQ